MASPWAPAAAALIIFSVLFGIFLALESLVAELGRTRAAWRPGPTNCQCPSPDSVDVELGELLAEAGRAADALLPNVVVLHPEPAVVRDRCSCGEHLEFDDVVETDLHRLYFLGTHMVHRCPKGVV